MSEGQLLKDIRDELRQWYYPQLDKVIEQAKAEFPKQLVGKKGPMDDAGYYEDDVAAWFKKWFGIVESQKKEPT